MAAMATVRFNDAELYMKSVNLMQVPGVEAGDADVIYKSFTLIAIAELFDKTWFVALLMALKYDKTIVFCGCFSALLAHTIIAAIFGYTIARVVPVTFLHFGAAALYAFFAVLFWQDYLNADEDSDIIAAGKEEAAEDCAGDADAADSYGATEGSKQTATKSGTTRMLKIFSTCFMAMFIAEWGDRTQIAMIGQHASQPLIPVCIGSALAFLLLTLSAVIVGQLLANTKLSEKMVHLVSALSFAVFAFLSLQDGLAQQKVDMR
jgi:putative Ca2+/H+ antiporter (TMEM165/GDT1 family)